MGMQMNFNGLEFPSYFDELKEIVTVVEPRLRPIPEMRRHVSRFMDGADMDEVYPGIFLGDCDAAMNEQYLLRCGVTHILNAAGNKCGPAPVKTGREFYKDPSLTYLGLDLIDLPFINISVHFDKATKFIDKALASGGKVLVHCRQGRSRSASIVAAYLMTVRSMTAARALTLLRQNREVRPNNGFLQQLADLDLNLFRARLEKMRNESSESESESEAGDETCNKKGSESEEEEEESEEEEEEEDEEEEKKSLRRESEEESETSVEETESESGSESDSESECDSDSESESSCVLSSSGDDMD